MKLNFDGCSLGNPECLRIGGTLMDRLGVGLTIEAKVLTFLEV